MGVARDIVTPVGKGGGVGVGVRGSIEVESKNRDDEQDDRRYDCGASPVNTNAKEKLP
jgi:hypothetical protein